MGEVGFIIGGLIMGEVGFIIGGLIMGEVGFIIGVFGEVFTIGNVGCKISLVVGLKVGFVVGVVTNGLVISCGLLSDIYYFVQLYCIKSFYTFFLNINK
jgi:hypothetical protein